MTYYSTAQLAQAAKRTERTIRAAVDAGYLAAEPKTPGVRGFRFRESNARKWLSLHHPDKKLPQ